MGLDFKRCTDLFLGSEEELAMALELDPRDLERLRRAPDQAPEELLERLGEVLDERGRGMIRVGEMLRERHGGAHQGNGAGSA